jgi:hypothetical protein
MKPRQDYVRTGELVDACSTVVKSLLDGSSTKIPLLKLTDNR